MQNLNWWLMALAFILGFVAFLLLTVRKVTREVPVSRTVSAAVGGGAKVAAAAAAGATAAKLTGGGEEPYGSGSLRLPRARSSRRDTPSRATRTRCSTTRPRAPVQADHRRSVVQRRICRSACGFHALGRQGQGRFRSRQARRRARRPVRQGFGQGRRRRQRPGGLDHQGNEGLDALPHHRKSLVQADDRRGVVQRGEDRRGRGLHPLGRQGQGCQGRRARRRARGPVRQGFGEARCRWQRSGRLADQGATRTRCSTIRRTARPTTRPSPRCGSSTRRPPRRPVSTSGTRTSSNPGA